MSLENPQTESVKDFNRLLCRKTDATRPGAGQRPSGVFETTPFVLDRVIMFLRPVNRDIQAETLGGQ